MFRSIQSKTAAGQPPGLSEPSDAMEGPHEFGVDPEVSRPAGWIEMIQAPAFVLSSDKDILNCNRAAGARFGIHLSGAPLHLSTAVRGCSSGLLRAALLPPVDATGPAAGVKCELAGAGQEMASFRALAWACDVGLPEPGLVLCLEPVAKSIDPLSMDAGADLNPMETLANWLHDQPAQLVTAAKMRLHQLQSNTCDPGLRSELQAVQTLLERAGASVREAMSGLQPPGLFEPSLLTAVQETIREIFSVFAIRCELICRGTDRGYTVATIDLAIRCLREGLINAAKHGGADAARLELSGDHDGLRLMLIDFGDGPEDRNVGPPTPGGYGLRWLRRRCRELGGDLSLTVTAGAGAELSLWLPDPVVGEGGG